MSHKELTYFVSHCLVLFKLNSHTRPLESFSFRILPGKLALNCLECLVCTHICGTGHFYLFAARLHLSMIKIKIKKGGVGEGGGTKGGA